MQSNQKLSTPSSTFIGNAEMSQVQISWAINKNDRKDVYRLRYHVLVEHMRLPMMHVEHDAKVLVDPQDRQAHILLARDSISKQCIGTLRTSILSEGDVGVYEELLGLKTLSMEERSTATVTSKLVISPDQLQHRLLSVRLAITMYLFGLDNGITVDYVAVRSNHVKFYTHLGYRSYKDQVVHPEGGMLCPLRVEVQNYKYLEGVCKPFPGLFRECMERKETRLIQPGTRIIQE